MAFYLRKGFNFGPIRINLSKSGLGVSAGVKGARLGVNSRGQSYVHGGRHGLYYRKNLGTINPQNKNSNPTNNKASLTEDEEIFTDTGLTYLPRSIEKPIVTIPPLFVKVGNTKLVLGIVLILIALFISDISIKIGLGLLGASLVFWNQQAKNKSKKFHQTAALLVKLEPEQQNSQNWQAHAHSLTTAEQERLAIHCASAWLEKQIQEGSILEIDHIKSFLPVASTLLDKMIISLYKDAVETVLADHQLTEEEEALISEMEKKWKIAPPIVQEEKKLIEKFRQIRNIQFTPLLSIGQNDSGDQIYFESEGRLLHLRVLDSWQQNRVRYKNMGYKLDMEGKLSISDKAFGITEGRNTRFYPNSQIEDIFLSAEYGVVEIFLKNRKSPVIISSPTLFEFSGVLNKVIES